MAKIIITTDDGTVIDTLVDTAEAEDSGIGHLEHPLQRAALMGEIAGAVKRARQHDRRHPVTGAE